MEEFFKLNLCQSFDDDKINVLSGYKGHDCIDLDYNSLIRILIFTFIIIIELILMINNIHRGNNKILLFSNLEEIVVYEGYIDFVSFIVRFLDIILIFSDNQTEVKYSLIAFLFFI